MGHSYVDSDTPTNNHSSNANNRLTFLKLDCCPEFEQDTIIREPCSCVAKGGPSSLINTISLCILVAIPTVIAHYIAYIRVATPINNNMRGISPLVPGRNKSSKTLLNID